MHKEKTVNDIVQQLETVSHKHKKKTFNNIALQLEKMLHIHTQSMINKKDCTIPSYGIYIKIATISYQ